MSVQFASAIISVQSVSTNMSACVLLSQSAYVSNFKIFSECKCQFVVFYEISCAIILASGLYCDVNLSIL